MSSIVIIGAASGKGQEYTEALLKRKDVKVEAVVVNQNIPPALQKLIDTHNLRVIKNCDLDALFKTTSFDTAVVSLPHDQHHFVTKALLEKGIFIIKEKPLAMTLAQAKEYKEKGAKIYTTVQRASDPFFVTAKKDLASIGTPRSFSYSYTFSLPNQTSGWRADPVKSGGGVVLDMGYHILDVVNEFFGDPTDIKAEFGYKFPQMEEAKLEDSAKITLNYGNFQGTLYLDRHAAAKEERFEIVGEKGTISITPTSYDLKIEGIADKHTERVYNKGEIIQQLFDTCFLQKQDLTLLDAQFEKNLGTMRMIDAIYAK